MAQRMGKVGFELQPLTEYVLEKIKQSEQIFAEETTMPTLAPRSGKTQKALLWTYARDDRPFGGNGPPMMAYRFEDSRSGELVERHLAVFVGILQVEAMPLTIGSRDWRATMRGWRALPKSGGGTTSFTSTRACPWRRRPSRRWLSCGRSRPPSAATTPQRG